MEETKDTEVLPYLDSASPLVDPVTKAVVDNILGKLPAKKEKVTLMCTICNLEFSSQIPLDMHLRGSKHNKKILSQDILKTLKEEGTYTGNGNNDFKCEICNVTSNSSQQLQMHLKGTKHMNKLKASTAKDENNSSGLLPLKRPAPPITDQDAAPPAKSVARRCETCNIFMNSESQYQQHIESQKHKNKVQGIKPMPKKWGNKQNYNDYDHQEFPGNHGDYDHQEFPGNHGDYDHQEFPGNHSDFPNGRKSFGSGVPPLSHSFNMENRGFNDRNFNPGRKYNSYNPPDPFISNNW